jgi:hypothetical protein
MAFLPQPHPLSFVVYKAAKGVTMQRRTTDACWNRKQGGGSKMNRCEWYWGRKTHWLLRNEEKATEVGFEDTGKCVNRRVRPGKMLGEVHLDA